MLLASCGKRRMEGTLTAHQQTQAEADFIREGIKLQEFVRQGVNIEQFGDELANVKTAFRIAAPAFEGRGFQEAEFQAAIDSWSDALQLWRLKVNGRRIFYYWELDQVNPILERLGRPAVTDEHKIPEDILVEKGSGYISTEKLVGLALTKGDDEFERAIKTPDVETAVARVKALQDAGK